MAALPFTPLMALETKEGPESFSHITLYNLIQDYSFTTVKREVSPFTREEVPVDSGFAKEDLGDMLTNYFGLGIGRVCRKQCLNQQWG
jgi:hypothetical protein